MKEELSMYKQLYSTNFALTQLFLSDVRNMLHKQLIVPAISVSDPMLCAFNQDYHPHAS